MLQNKRYFFKKQTYQQIRKIIQQMFEFKIFCIFKRRVLTISTRMRLKLLLPDLKETSQISKKCPPGERHVLKKQITNKSSSWLSSLSKATLSAT